MGPGVTNFHHIPSLYQFHLHWSLFFLFFKQTLNGAWAIYKNNHVIYAIYKYIHTYRRENSMKSWKNFQSMKILLFYIVYKEWTCEKSDLKRASHLQRTKFYPIVFYSVSPIDLKYKRIIRHIIYLNIPKEADTDVFKNNNIIKCMCKRWCRIWCIKANCAKYEAFLMKF